MPRLYVVTSTDLGVLEAQFRDTSLPREMRLSAWLRFSTIKWYNAVEAGRVPLRQLDKPEREAVYAYIIERNLSMKGLNDDLPSKT
jgi:hypothetical protein